MPPFESARVLAALLSDPANRLPEDADERRRLMESAARQGLGPWLAGSLRPLLTGSDRAWCDEKLTRSWRQYSRMLGAATEILGILGSVGILTLALKGPVLALRRYAPPFLRRPSADLDIGVADRDLEAACKALEGAGYVLRSTLQASRAIRHHAVLTHETLPEIELHYRLTHGTLGTPIAELLKDCIPFDLPGGATTMVLGPAEELLHLCLHSVDSRFAPWFHLFEFRRLWEAADPVVREQCLARAVERHMVGALLMMDVALRAIWQEGLIPDTAALPRTWLDFRINQDLLSEFEAWGVESAALGGVGIGLKNRIHGRWLDVQLTDRPADAWKQVAALFHLWREQRNLSSR